MVEGAGIAIARGIGSLTGKKTIKITLAVGDTVEVQANLAVILGLGSVPIFPNFPGLDQSSVWTPRDATSAQTAPEHLVIIGAGTVGTEMATAYSSLGSTYAHVQVSRQNRLRQNRMYQMPSRPASVVRLCWLIRIHGTTPARTIMPHRK